MSSNYHHGRILFFAMSMTRKPTRNNTVVTDSSTLISSFLGDDRFHYESCRKIAHFKNRNFLIIIPLPVVLEIITVMHRKGLSISEIENIVINLKSKSHYKIVELPKEDLIQSAIYSYPNINLRSADYHIILYALYFNPTYFETFDLIQKTAYNLIKSKLP